MSFAYQTTDGGMLAASSLRGRFSVIAFITTYDLISQAQVKVLGLVLRHHAPRVNVAAIVLEPPENRPLAMAFGKSLGVPFPIGVTDLETLHSSGPFREVRHVPSVVILDKEGRLVMHHTGPMEEKPLRAELERLGARKQN